MGQPGFARQSQYRTTFRVLAVLLGVVAVGCFVRFGLLVVADERAFGTGTPDSGLAPMGWFLAGGIAMVLGVGLANLGFMGTAARYGAGETMPVLKDSATYLSDGEGVLGVGRTVGDRPRDVASTGPFCRRCGTRNDETARFCDSCGQSLA